MSQSYGISKTEAWKHQIEAYNRAFASDGYGVFLGPGAGKTKVAVDLLANWDCKRVLIVTIHSALNDKLWEREIAKHGAFQAAPNVVSLTDGGTTYKSTLMRSLLPLKSPHPLIFIANYESVWKGDLGKTIASVLWDAVILDEGHHIKAAGSSVSKFFGRMVSRSKHRLVLTGTPMPHSPLDVYGVFRFIDPRLFGTRYDHFLSKYAVVGGKSGYQILAYRNVKDIRQTISTASYYVETSQVLDLPEVMQVSRTTTLESDARKVYDVLSKEMVAFVQGQSISVDNILTKILRLQQIVGGYASMDGGGFERVSRVKEGLLRDALEELRDSHQQEPVVVFGFFRKDLEVITSVAKSLGYVTSELSGDVKQFGLWKAGMSDLLVCQSQSGGEALDMTRARHAIFYNKTYSYGQYVQLMARIHRPGQTRNVRFVSLIVKDTIDEIIEEALAAKKDVIEYILEVYRT